MNLRQFSLFLGLAAALGFGACRKPAPDETVYTGKSPSTGGVGGTGGTGGALPTGGSGGSAGGDGGVAVFDGIDGAAPDVPFSKPALLSQLADCAVAHYQHFAAQADELEKAASGHAAARTPATSSSARGAFVQAMAAWQQAELFRFGPAAQATEPGGQDFRDNIYAWPLFGRCKVEEQLVSQAYSDPGFATSLINGRGLGALEYTLYYSGSDNACTQFSAINANGTWAALGDPELALRKAHYAAAVAKDVRARSLGLLSAWSPSGGNFRFELAKAGSGSAVFASDQKALNAVSDALFYIEREVKDLKLGRPIGLVECFTATCPEAVESPYAGLSVDHVRQNLIALRRLFHGCYPGNTGLGFEDWLRAVGASDIADDLGAAIAGALVATTTIDLPLEQAVVAEPAQAAALHQAIKQISDLLKVEFVTVLNLELPKTVVGDND